MTANRYILILVAILVVLAVTWFGFGLYTWFSRTTITYQISPNGQIQVTTTADNNTSSSSVSSSNQNFSQTISSPTVNNILVRAENLEVPVDIAGLPDGRLLLAERKGQVKIINQDNTAQVVFAVSDVVASGESGLLSLTLDPKFVDNHKLYLLSTYRNQTGDLFNKISSYVITSQTFVAGTTTNTTLAGLTLTNEQIILDHIPAGVTNNAGLMTFGPDGKLFVLTGDSGKAVLAQDPESLAGKVLRLNTDGTVPKDNPYSGSLVYALGLRNPQGLTWNPKTKQGFIIEADTAGHDKLDVLTAGANYGWPVINDCQTGDSRFVNPIACSSNSAWSPAGLVFVAASTTSGNDALVTGGLNSKSLFQFDIRGLLTSSSTLLSPKVILSDTYGRIRNLRLIGKSVYLMTSNRDGRGSFKAGDDKIISFELAI